VRDLPRGTVTFLFTDIEGSTRLLHELGPAGYADALAAHRRAVRETVARCGGVEVDTQGDAFFVAFGDAPHALRAAGGITEELAPGPVRVRMGVHTGSPLVTEEGYVGTDVHQAARIGAAGHGGQVLVSPTTAELVDESFDLLPLGAHRLKDFDQPVSLFQLGEGEFPPLKTIANTNLPSPASSFLGREGELFHADDLLRTSRLLTVTGPGGAGKTRFALELSRRAREERFSDYRDGVFWVPLVSLRDPKLVLDTVAQALGAQSGPRDAIAGKRMLLLLDNFEHVIEAAHDLSSLLDDCPNLTALVTSRELLRLRGENEYELPALTEDDGVLLFCERAQRPPNDEIRELCRRLDGLPLAIELAAARARMLSPSELLERLSERLDLLKGGRDAEPRQQTIRATIEWSHDLLSAEEKELFRRLAVFAGGWTFEAAGTVMDAELDALQSLFDKSLLRRSQDARFFMLETIREYAHERLEQADELETVSGRHAEFMVRCAQEALDEAESWEGARKLEPERENLRAAMRWTLDAAQSGTALMLATAYSVLCAYRGPLGEGRSWLAEALQADGGDASPERVTALLGAAALAARQRDLEPARRLAEQGLNLARSIDDSTGVMRALVGLGVGSGIERDYEQAESQLREALALARGAGNGRYEREALSMLGWLTLAQHKYTEAREVIGEGLELSRRAGDARGIFYATGNLGHVAAREGRYEEARKLLREALLIGQHQDVQSEADGLQELSTVAVAQGHYEEAAVLLGAAEALLEGAEAAQEEVARTLREETLAILHRNLEHDDFTAASDRGRAMTLEQAVAYAIQFIDSSPD
jgi:predicted ATPase/class 3 adenylate cyclase